MSYIYALVSLCIYIARQASDNGDNGDEGDEGDEDDEDDNGGGSEAYAYMYVPTPIPFNPTTSFHVPTTSFPFLQPYPGRQTTMSPPSPSTSA